MLYLVMYLVPLMLKTTANALWNSPEEESMADAWDRQQRRIREAIAQAKLEHASAKPANADDEWVGPWVSQQTRLREAIAHAKRENQTGKTHGPSKLLDSE